MDPFASAASFRFLFPIDGDCLNIRDGRLTPEGLVVPVTVAAPEGCEIYVQGTKATWNGQAYTAEALIGGRRCVLVAEDRTNEDRCKITVFHFPDAVGKYRISSDDNILFLANLTKNQDVYTSIFEDPYLAVYKKAHDLYGAKVHLNLFYCFPGTRGQYATDREYFDLSMMTDKFRDEFRANAHWLKLAFHSYQEDPPAPYQFAKAETIREDCIKVCREILRFAGPECLTDSTTVHFGEANIDCVRALRELGMRSLTGYFERQKGGVPLVAYYTDGPLLDHIGARDFWYDTEEDMLFGRIDLVLNLNTYDWVMDTLHAVAADPHRSGFISLMIHEQYFYADYCHHLPDFEARVLDACKYVHDLGYVGSHISTATDPVPLREHPTILG